MEPGSCPIASCNICKDCGMVFPSSRSLGMYRHHRHPVEINQERITVLHGRRKGWTSGEDEELRVRADSIWREGMRKKDHLTHLHVTFPHRTVEALKKRLQFLKWTRPETSMELQQQSPMRDYVPDQRDQTTTTGPTWTTEAERLPTQSNTQQDNRPINRAANKWGEIVEELVGG